MELFAQTLIVKLSGLKQQVQNKSLVYTLKKIR